MRNLTLLISALVASFAAIGEPARDGVTDPAFGVNGVALVRPGRYFERLRGIIRQADGKLIVLGGAPAGGGSQPSVTRVLPDGSPDLGFGVGGEYVLPAIPGINDWGGSAKEAVILSDGRIVVVGSPVAGMDSHGFCVLVFALTSSGQLDPSYGPGPGPACLSLGPDNTGSAPEAIATVAHGAADSVYIGGSYGPGNELTASSAIARLDATGALVTTFGDNGIRRYGSSLVLGLGLQSPSILLTSAGSLLLGGVRPGGGALGTAMAVAKVDATGEPVLDFGDQGIATVRFSDESNVGSGIALDPVGRILIGGLARQGPGRACSYCIARFTPAGILDGSLNPSGQQPGQPGRLRLVASPDFGLVSAFVFRNDGRVVAIGSLNGVSVAAFGLNDDGSFDPRFGDASTPGMRKTWFGLLGFNFAFASVATDGSRITITGAGGAERSALLQLMDDRVLESSFE